jgi:REP element-mobilizing transposase RayT
MTYLLTFSCYGTRVPGDERGWVDRPRGNCRGGYHDPNADLARYSETVMAQEPYQLDLLRARMVLDAIQETCQFRGWDLIAAHARSTHVHVVVAGPANPDRAVRDFKSYSSRALNRHGSERVDRRRWARGGSTLQLSSVDAVREAVESVVDRQGDPMAVYQSEPEPPR